MDYYPSVTNVKAVARVRRARLLGRDGEVTARPGQQVSPIQVVARAAQETGFQMLHASRVLEVPPEKLADYLLVEEGAAVQRGMPLLQRSYRFGRTRRYGSPVDGVIHRIWNGTIILQETPTLFELRAMLSGEVVQLVPQRGVVIETKGSFIEGIWGSGSEGFGKINIITSAPDGVPELDLIGPQATGNILVTGRLTDRAMLVEAEDNGVRGIIAGSMPAALFGDLSNMGRDDLRGRPTFAFPIVLTDGVGDQGMAGPIFELLQGCQGREASVFAWQGRRPEIIVPLADAPESNTVPGLPGQFSVTVGQLVRILRGPHAYEVGRIARLYEHPQPMAAGNYLPAAGVQLEDGQLVPVPYANLDIIM